MDSDNHRLSAILAASRELSSAPHTHSVADTASGTALALTEARAVYVLLQAARGKPLLVCESAGEDSAPLYQGTRSASASYSTLPSPAVRGPPFSCGSASGDSCDEIPSAIVVVPLTVANGLRGAFVLIHTKPAAFFLPETDGCRVIARRLDVRRVPERRPAELAAQLLLARD
jgi:hypothetical protein